jgi:hypothetical protein
LSLKPAPLKQISWVREMSYRPASGGAHAVVPLGLADGQQWRPAAAFGDADDGHVDLMAAPGLGIVHDAVSDAGREAAEQVGIRVVQRSLPADLFEVRPEDIADEAAAAGLPDPSGTAGPLQHGVEDGPYHPVVKVVRAAGRVTAGEFTAVGRGAADNRVDPEGQSGIGSPIEKYSSLKRTPISAQRPDQVLSRRATDPGRSGEGSAGSPCRGARRAAASRRGSVPAVRRRVR